VRQQAHVKEALTWLAFAIGDLEASRSQPRRYVRPRHVANLAQQATEKALKAALILEGQSPPKSHDLDDLRNRLPPAWKVHRSPRDLSRLSDYAADARYPDSVNPVTPLDSATAVRQAISVVRSIRQEFEGRGIDTEDLVPR
jgi:HEPN domain-containing protein